MRIFRLIVLTSIATLVLEISSAAPAQQPHVTSEQVMHAVQEVEKLAQKQIDQNAVPGLAIAVVFQDKVVYAKGFEVRDANTKAFKRVSTPERTSQSSRAQHPPRTILPVSSTSALGARCISSAVARAARR